MTLATEPLLIAVPVALTRIQRTFASATLVWNVTAATATVLSCCRNGPIGGSTASVATTCTASGNSARFEMKDCVKPACTCSPTFCVDSTFGSVIWT